MTAMPASEPNLRGRLYVVSPSLPGLGTNLDTNSQLGDGALGFGFGQVQMIGDLSIAAGMTIENRPGTALKLG